MLPFFFLEYKAKKKRRDLARRHLHPGYNTIGDTLTDIGLDRELSDDALLNWLRMIAGEAIEQWKLPGFEVPGKNPDLADRVRKLWEPGLLEAKEPLMAAVADYPFNGFCGGIGSNLLERDELNRKGASLRSLPAKPCVTDNNPGPRLNDRSRE